MIYVYVELGLQSKEFPLTINGVTFVCRKMPHSKTLINLEHCIPRAHSQILMMGQGGGRGQTEVHIIYPKKSQLQNLSTQKN